MKERMLAMIVVLLLAGTACGVSGAGSDEPTPTPTEVPSLPVSINEGLASLDSYRLTFTSEVYDSVAQQRTVTTIETARDRATDASYSRNETVVTTDAEGIPSGSVTEQYAIGNQLCVVTDGVAEPSAVSEMARTMSDLMSQVVILQPLIENPAFVADEVVNGVPVRTYTFEVRSLGASSEAEATRADGDYAIAVDGEYLVRYHLDLELRSGPEGDAEAEVSASTFEFNLQEINQPVSITFPQVCLDAGAGVE